MMPLDCAPACADDLALVDAAFERSKVGNAAARELARLCRRCPVAAECLTGALARREREGVWGATRRGGKADANRVKVVA